MSLITAKLKTRKNIASLFSVLPFLLLSNIGLAELQWLEENELSQVTGQAGLTIDIETAVQIGEIEYVDAGSLWWKDISLTGIGGGLVDNIRAKIDISDGTETLATGFSDYAKLASWGYLDTNDADVAWALTEYDDGNGNFGKQYNDGDLLIHVTSTDLGGVDVFNAPDPADHQANLENLKNAVDLHYQEGSFGLRSSDGSVETTISSNFSVEAYLGYLDISIRNNGNDFTPSDGTGGKPRNVSLMDSYMEIDVKFRVEDLDIDNTSNALNTFIPRAVTTPGLTIRDMRIHNERGYDTLGSFGFASLQQKMAAATDILYKDDTINNYTYVDGQAIYDINVKWDWDLPHISFGDTGQTIGAVYFTDFHISDTSLVISAH